MNMNASMSQTHHRCYLVYVAITETYEHMYTCRKNENYSHAWLYEEEKTEIMHTSANLIHKY